MAAWLLVLVSAGMRDAPPEKPEGETGEWVWVPSSHAETVKSVITMSSADAETVNSVVVKAAADAAAQSAADDEAEEKNREIWKMKANVNLLRDAIQNLNNAYEHAEDVAATVGSEDNLRIMEDLSSNTRRRASSFVELPDAPATPPQDADFGFEGLSAIQDRLEQSHSLLKRQLDKIPDSMVALSALKLPKSAKELLAGPSSFLEDPDGDADSGDAAQLAETVEEKKLAQQDAAALKRSFAGLEDKRSELAAKRKSLGGALEELEALAQHDQAMGHAKPASLVQQQKAGHWEWRRKRAAPAAAETPQAAAPELTDAKEMQELDAALAPLGDITQSVKKEQADLAQQLSNIANGVEVTADGNLRAD